jgi:Tol biopolymer transport system component
VKRMTALAVVAASLLVACEHPTEPRHPPARVASFDLESGLGSKLVFIADRPGRDLPDEIYVANGDGTNEQRITFTDAVAGCLPTDLRCPPTGNNLMPEWSPNGNQIAFGSDRSGVFEVYVVNADGSELHQVTMQGGAHPAWSPDGRRLAFTGSGVGGASDVWVINVDGTGLVNLTNDPAVDARPDWSPDGRRIAFSSNRGGTTKIYVMNADGSDPVQLTFGPGTDMGADWSPNGQKIAFESSRDGNREIYVMSGDGAEQTRLTFDTRIDAFPSWSPDGKWIAFHRQVVTIPGLLAPNGSELFAIKADGTELTQLTHATPASFSAFVSWGQGHPSQP